MVDHHGAPVSVFGRPVLLAGLLATVFVGLNLARADPDLRQDDGVPYVALYADPDTPAELLVNQGDGQAFAALAQDPTLSRPDAFLAGSGEAAYRAQRPALGWIVWISSGGQAPAVPVLLFVWAVIGAAVLVLSARLLLADRGGPAPAALAALFLPGSLIDLDWSGPEAIGTGIALIGVWRWQRNDTFGAVGLLTAAAFFRESLILVAAGLFLHEIITHRRPTPRALRLVVVPVLLGVWWLVIRWRLDAWPTEAGEGRLSLPSRGLGEALSGWVAGDWMAAIMLVAGFGVALLRSPSGRLRSDPLWCIAALHAAFAVTMGQDVWKRWEDFGRPLLPLYVTVLVLALTPTTRRFSERTFSPAEAGAG